MSYTDTNSSEGVYQKIQSRQLSLILAFFTILSLFVSN